MDGSNGSDGSHHIFGRNMLLILISLLAACPSTAALSLGPVGSNPQLSRRDALVSAGTASAAAVNALVPPPAGAAPLEADTVDLAAFNAARNAVNVPKSAPNAVRSDKVQFKHTIIPSLDPSPLLSIRGGRDGKSTVRIPRVGYSLYKTPPEQAARCVALALRCGVRHFDVGTLYGSNAEVSKPLQKYLDNGFPGLKSYYKEEKPELLGLLDAVNDAGEKHAVLTIGGQSRSMPPMDGSAGRRARRDQLFVSHKLSNDEQSSDVVAVKRRVKAAIAELGVGYLDLVSIHSPLTDESRRRASYRALLELRDSGFVRSVGVCNYGVGPLREIAAMVGDSVADLPAINQLELSPFNRHRGVVGCCDANGIAVGCSAWSKLSGVDGPAEGWAVLSDLAKSKGVTKAQLLVRWALQEGYVCVPRSGSSSKLERVAIAQNSYGGANDLTEDIGGASFRLSEEDLKTLDGLDVGYKAGTLGRRDGWGDADVAGPEWDPTDFV